MSLKCKCGSTDFKPVGIQEGWSGRKSDRIPRMLFLVNCTRCGTTIACESLTYALLRKVEIEQEVDLTFFTAEKKNRSISRSKS